MVKTILSSGVVHEIPKDLRTSLSSRKEIAEAWNNLTPLGRNEFICWVMSVKKPETRRHHIQRVCAEIAEGKRRPCCWPGCAHR